MKADSIKNELLLPSIFQFYYKDFKMNSSKESKNIFELLDEIFVNQNMIVLRNLNRDETIIKYKHADMNFSISSLEISRISQFKQ